MIDPLGPDSTTPPSPSGTVAEIVPEFEVPRSLSALRPKVRHANYDSPEAQIRVVEPPLKPELPRAKVLPRKDAPPRIQEAILPAQTPEPVAPVRPLSSRPEPRSVPSPRPASTALARPIPPKPGKFERALGIAKTVLPIMGKMLPLLEGNFVSAASNLLAHPPHVVDLKPLEESISRLQSDHRALAFHSTEQKRALRRLEDDFAALQETVQKNAADQAEVIEHLAKLAKRTSSFMRTVTILLVVTLLFTLLLCIRIAYIIRF